MDQHQSNKAPCRAVFLDRDGVINGKLPENHYVASIDDFRFLSGAVEALGILRRLGFVLVVVTNQRGIARGFMTEEDLKRVHDFMCNVLKKHNIVLDGIYHCPHEKFEKCSCRKPEPGMILRAMEDFRIDPVGSYMVGDSPSDMEAGRKAGVKTVRIGRDPDDNAEMVFEDLLEFARYLEGEQKPAEGTRRCD